MRTNIVIDDALLAEVRAATGAKTKQEAVDISLRQMLQLRRHAAIRELRGKIQWEGDLDAMRRDR